MLRLQDGVVIPILAELAGQDVLLRLTRIGALWTDALLPSLAWRHHLQKPSSPQALISSAFETGIKAFPSVPAPTSVS